MLYATVESLSEPTARELLAADRLAYLDPAPPVFEAMLDGWARQQRVRFLKPDTVRRRVEMARRLWRFSNQYPWEWTAAEIEAYIDHLRSGPKPIVVSTARGYLNDLRMLLEYLTDPRYEWPALCQERFGRVPVQVLDRWNTVAHVSAYEGEPGRRPLTYDEIQALFDAADGRVEEIRARGRKGGFAAQRDAAMLKTIYAYGLRRREAAGLDLADLRRNPKVPAFKQFGAVARAMGQVLARLAAEAADRAARAGDGLGRTRA